MVGGGDFVEIVGLATRGLVVGLLLLLLLLLKII
jgi:hypothetical protein